MTAAGAVLIVAVLLIVLALVYFLVSTIVQLRKITAGLDEVSAAVARSWREAVRERLGERDQRSARPARPSVGLLVKKAGLHDAMGLIRRRLPRAAAAAWRNSPKHHVDAPSHRQALHPRHAHPRATRARGSHRPLSPKGAGAAQHRGRPPAARPLTLRSPESGEAPHLAHHGADAPEQYEQRDDIVITRKRLPAGLLIAEEQPLQLHPPSVRACHSLAGASRHAGPWLRARVIAVATACWGDEGGCHPEHLVDINALRELRLHRRRR